MGYVFGIALIVAGVWIVVRANKRHMDQERYEFENRTGGGVIQFKTFEDGKRHEAKKVRTNMLLTCAGVLISAGVLVMLITRLLHL